MTRQVYNDTWASTGDIVDPGAPKYTLGWIVEAPPHEHFNYWQGRTDEMLQHLERNGISTYEATTVYELGGYAREGTVTYRSLVVTNTGNLPSTSPVEWVQAFLIPANNLSDLADAPTARTNLGVDAAGTINYTHPNHTGDVTSTGDGATVIATDVVDNTKLANIAQDSIKGRIGAGTGDPQDLTAANVRTIINVEDGATADQTKGDIDGLGVDAATLDGNLPSAFETADTTIAKTGEANIFTVVQTITTASSVAQSKTTNTDTTHDVRTLWAATGTSWNIRPSPLGVGDATDEFGYDFTASNWFFDKSILVAGSAVATLGADQVFTGALTFGETTETTRNETLVGGTFDLEAVEGGIQSITLSQNTTISNLLADGQSLTLQVNDGSGYTITWPTMTWVNGSAPVLATTGRTVIELWVSTGVIRGAHVGNA